MPTWSEAGPGGNAGSQESCLNGRCSNICFLQPSTRMAFPTRCILCAVRHVLGQDPSPLGATLADRGLRTWDNPAPNAEMATLQRAVRSFKVKGPAGQAHDPGHEAA